ncbi:MAG: hypothetical protein EB127_05910 [Alphaproteobacteria bacterium]|nr:hypothetical protein [Alphaproteobacteria bacterium]
MIPDNNLDELLQQFKKGGWIMAILGGAGMLARLILTDAKYDTWIWIRKIIAGGITGIICYFALYGLDIDPIYKSVMCSMSGAIAPELFEILRNKLIKKLSNI